MINRVEASSGSSLSFFGFPATFYQVQALLREQVDVLSSTTRDFLGDLPRPAGMVGSEELFSLACPVSEYELDVDLDNRTINLRSPNSSFPEDLFFSRIH